MLAIYRYAVSSPRNTRQRFRYCVADSVASANQIAQQREATSSFWVAGDCMVVCSVADAAVNIQTEQLRHNSNLLDKLQPVDRELLVEAIREQRGLRLNASASRSTELADDETATEQRPVTGVDCVHAISKLPGRTGRDYAKQINTILGRG